MSNFHLEQLKDNKSNLDGVAALARMAFDGDATKIQTARDLSLECADITDADRCEAAFKIFECGHSAVKSRGITYEDLE